MPSTSQTQGLSDEQVEELLHALLDFHRLLVGLTDRFQARLAQVEQRIAQERAAAPTLGQPMTRDPISPLPRKMTPSHALEESTPQPSEHLPEATPGPISLLKELEAEVFEPDAGGEEFSIVDFDDDEF